ncbi:MAG: ABC transporter transmembrane domain-containing protein [Planctomycetaceae bacterium]
MEFASRIWDVLGRDRKLMLYSVLFGLTFTGLGVIPPLLVRQMIFWLRDPGLAGSFWVLGGFIAIVYILRGFTRYFYGLCSHIAAYRTLHRLSLEVYEHIQSLPPSYTTKRHSGNLVARSIGDVEAIEDYIAHGIPESLLAVLVPSTLSIVLLTINWQLALIALLPLPMLGLLVYLVTSSTRNAWRGVRSRFAAISARIQDHLSGLSVIQSFVREEEMTHRLRNQSREYRDRIIYANKWSLVPAGIVESASGAGLVLLVWSAGWIQTPANPDSGLQVDVADLVVLLMYLGQIVLPFLRLANLTENLQKSAASAERVFALLDTPSQIC